ncbi:partial Luminescence regulatory protein LuxO, partial [Anaerolineae bacterium]
IGRLIDVVLDVPGVFRAVPECAGPQEAGGKGQIRHVHRHLRDDDDLEQRVQLLHLLDELLSAESSRDLEIQNDDVVPVIALTDELQRGLPVRNDIGDMDAGVHEADRLPHAFHIEFLVLDEVSELPHPAQVKLLRVIQEGEIEKIGRRGALSVNVRIIAATNKELSREVSEHRFREDLFYRLNVIPLDLVPLKERGTDILELFTYFLGYFSADMNMPTPEVDEKAKEILLNYRWPGNVRELRNVAQRLVLNTSGRITAKDMTHPMILRTSPLTDEVMSVQEVGGGQILPLKEIERLFRTNYFKYVRSISSSDSNAAERLGLAPSNFYRMCKELGIK